MMKNNMHVQSRYWLVLDIHRRLLARFPTLRLYHLSEESSEAVNKFLKSFQLDHAFQGDLRLRNMQTFQKLMARSDPEVHRHLDRQTLRAERRQDPDHYPAEVQALARDQNETKKPEDDEEEDED